MICILKTLNYACFILVVKLVILIFLKQRKVIQTADSLVEIAERFIKQSSKVKNTVFDPFAGKGDFLNVAIKNKRQCYGFSTEQNLDKNLFYIIKPNDNKFESVIED